jgi:hypothetical protein
VVRWCFSARELSKEHEMPRTAKAPVVREYLVRLPDDRDYARDADLEMCKHAANGLGTGAYVLQLDEQLIPFGEPVYTVPDPELPQLDGSEQARDHAEQVLVEEATPELSPQAARVVSNVKRIREGKRPQDKVQVSGGDEELAFPSGCACGCGETTEGINSGKRRFVQGHDQRLIGTLATANEQGRRVRWTTAEQGETVGKALDYGSQVFSDWGMVKLRRACGVAAPAPEVATEPAPEPEGQPVPEDTVGRLLPGDEVKVKIGRHERYARIHGMNQAGKVTAVRYTTAKDPEKELVTDKFTILD